MIKYLYLLIFISGPAFSGWEDSYDRVREARERYYDQIKSGPITQQSRKQASLGLSESNLALANDLVAINRKSESKFFQDRKPGEADPVITNTNPTLSDVGLDDSGKPDPKLESPTHQEDKKSVLSRASASVKEFVDSVLAPEEETAPIDGSTMPKFIEFKSKK